MGPLFLPLAANLARLRPRPRILLIKFWADSVTYLDTIAGDRCIGSLALSDIDKDLATVTRLADHCFGHARQEWADPAEEIADPVSSLKVERGGVDRTDLRGGKSTSSLIQVVHF